MSIRLRSFALDSEPLGSPVKVGLTLFRSSSLDIVVGLWDNELSSLTLLRGIIEMKPIYPTLEAVGVEMSDDSYLGWCINCGDWTHDSCEPDARNYICPECGLNTCFGAEELVVSGKVY